MKRTVAIVAGLATLGAGVYVGSCLWAQAPAGRPAGAAPAAAGTPAAAPQPLRTRIGLLNLSYVVKNYTKWSAFQEEFKKDYKVFEEQAKQKKADLDRWQEHIKKPGLDAAGREQADKEIRRLTREIQDIDADAKAKLSKKNDDQLIVIYKEVRDMVQRYAQAHDLELVLHYNDATTKEEYDTPMNIARKMSAGACMPMYIPAGMDISYDVVNSLNAAFRQANPGAAAAPAGGAAPGGGR